MMEEGRQPGPAPADPTIIAAQAAAAAAQAEQAAAANAQAEQAAAAQAAGFLPEQAHFLDMLI